MLPEKLDYYKQPGISNSQLSLFNYDMDLYYKVYISKELPQKESDSLLLGSLVHDILAQEDIKEKYEIIDIPKQISGKMGIYIESLAKYHELNDNAFSSAFVEADYSKSTNPERIKTEFLEKEENRKFYEYLRIKTKEGIKKIVSKEDLNLALELARIVENNPLWEIITPEDTINNKTEIFLEKEFFWTDSQTQLKLKAKLDKIYVNHNTKHIKYFDYKTDSRNPIWKYKETFEYWKTYRQFAFYNLALMNWAEYNNMADYYIDLYVVPIDIKNKRSEIMLVGEEYLIRGEDEIRKDLIQLNWHIQNNLWQYTKSQYDQLELQKIIILNP